MAKSHSNSESESNGKVHKPSHNSSNNAHGSNSSRLTTQQQQQQYLKDLTTRHINNNHPKLFNTKQNAAPLDLNYYDDDFLRRYKDHYNLNTVDNFTLSGFLLKSPVGELTHTMNHDNNNSNPDATNNKNNSSERSSREDLVKSCQEHLNNVQVKELDLIPQFIYKVRKHKNKFKMEFS